MSLYILSSQKSQKVDCHVAISQVGQFNVFLEAVDLLVMLGVGDDISEFF